MELPANALQSFSDKDVVENLVEVKKIYDDLTSINTNNQSQIKSKFKLCISLSETLDNILDGKIFGVSCTYLDWHSKVKHTKISKDCYVSCSSRALNTNVSAYLPQDMEILSYSEIRTKIENPTNGFKLKAEMKPDKYKRIQKMFNAHLLYSNNTSQSVEAIKALIGEVADLSALKSYGVNLKS